MTSTKNIVAVSGGFDPVHCGHARMFEEARALGDELVVIINNDHWLRKKKGFVFMPEHERAELIQKFAAVDHVLLTEHPENAEDMTVCEALGTLRPTIFANGGDRHATNTPESELCEKLGIELVYNIGDGGKIQSSSWMIADAAKNLTHRDRPWGSFDNLFSIPGVHVKTLSVLPGARLSLQRHKYRNETWILVDGDAQAVTGTSLDDLSTQQLRIDEPFRIPQGALHRLASENGGTLIEISYGTFDENDIERLSDDYGRVP